MLDFMNCSKGLVPVYIILKAVKALSNSFWNLLTSSWSVSWRMWSRRRRVWAQTWGRFRITLSPPGKSLLHRRWQHLCNHPHGHHCDHPHQHRDRHNEHHRDHCGRYRHAFLLFLLSWPTFGNWKRRLWPNRARLRWWSFWSPTKAVHQWIWLRKVPTYISNRLD